MPSLRHKLPRLAQLLIGILAIIPIAYQWFLHYSRPPRKYGIRCGNCFLAQIGVPTELALVGLILIAACLLDIRLRDHYADWTLIAVGIFGTPLVVGLPIFVVGLLGLAIPVASAAFARSIHAGPANPPSQPQF